MLQEEFYQERRLLMRLPMTKDIRREYGIEPEKISGPYELRPAKRDGTGRDGGTLDQCIVGRLSDGRLAVVGEVWAMGPAGERNERTSYDVQNFAKRLVAALNKAEGFQ
jgi:hypothetical protein